MTAETWSLAMTCAVEEYQRGNSHALDGLAAFLADAEAAKHMLRDKGYGWLGLGLLETVKEVPDAFVEQV